MANKTGKGPAFERWLCGELSKWWTGDPNCNDCLFWRTAGSGARATTRAKVGKETSCHHGDILAVDERGKPLTNLLCIELKRGYNRATIQDLIDRPAAAKIQTYEGWIGKLRSTAKQSGRPYWLLIVKRDRREALMLLPWYLHAFLAPEITDAFQVAHLCYLDKNANPCHVAVARLNQWLNRVKPTRILEALQRYYRDGEVFGNNVSTVHL